MNTAPHTAAWLNARRENAAKRCSLPVVMTLVAVVAGTATAAPTQETTSVNKKTIPSTVELQNMTALSSMQLYTQFALIRNMLEGKWNEKVFEQFSFYDGMNLQMMQSYEKQLAEDKRWGPFLKMKNSLPKKIYDDLQPLIRQKRNNENLTDADLETLEAWDKLIFDKLVK